MEGVEDDCDRTCWNGLPHSCTGLHNVPDTPDILRGLLAADRTRRARSVRDLYRLLLDQERLFPATAPVSLVVAALLDDPRTLAEDRWERRAGTRPLRAELLNWLANFADLARHDVRDGVGTPQDLAAARAVRPALHARVAPFCENEDPRVREAAVAATALLLADLVLAASVPRHAPAVRDVLAPSADSYYRWIARERLEAWGEGISDLLAVEQERRAAAGRAHALARDPFDEGGERAARWPAGQPEDTAALEPPGRWHPARAAVERAAPPGPAPEPPTAVRGAKPDRRSPWQTTMPHHDEWTFTPYIGVGPLHLGMSLQEIAATLRETGTVLSTYDPGSGEHSLTLAEFPTTGIRALFGRSNGLACVAVGAQNGPQVRLDGTPLTGGLPHVVENRLAHRPARGDPRYSSAGALSVSGYGLAIRSQRVGDIEPTRPLFLPHEWLDLWHYLPREEWDLR
ncbi:hypothetical protein [Kitasatospora sp. NPDC127116]|uniref:hypothetical protein n=1 Tax=Kitasatospora sp. NPDC127116 TaxID=3345367 RepID=UPI0036402BB9